MTIRIPNFPDSKQTMPDETTRDRLFQYLQIHRSADVPELSTALQVTRQDVRYNLNLLISSGLVRRVTDKAIHNPHKPGRPSVYYCLDPQTRPDNLNNLVRALLKTTFSDVDLQTGSNEPLQRVAQILAGLPAPASVPRNLHARLNLALQELNRNQYRAHWEARPDGPCVLFANCPYAALLAEFPILCALDGELLHTLTGRQVQQLAKIDPAGGSPHHCLFKFI